MVYFQDFIYLTEKGLRREEIRVRQVKEGGKRYSVPVDRDGVESGTGDVREIWESKPLL